MDPTPEPTEEPDQPVPVETIGCTTSDDPIEDPWD